MYELKQVETRTYMHNGHMIDVVYNPEARTGYEVKPEYEAWIYKADYGIKQTILSEYAERRSFEEFCEAVVEELECNFNYDHIGWYDHEADGLTDNDGYMAIVQTISADGLVISSQADVFYGYYDHAERIIEARKLLKEIEPGQTVKVMVFDLADNHLSTAFASRSEA